jgi:hypothetical protein
MYRQNMNIKPKCSQQTGKALSNYESFGSSQSHETVPYIFALQILKFSLYYICVYVHTQQEIYIHIMSVVQEQ